MSQSNQVSLFDDVGSSYFTSIFDPRQLQKLRQPTGGNSGFTTSDANYDYEADDAEAVIYLITQSGKLGSRCLYVMRRADAVRFCSDDRTKGTTNYGHEWAYAFTTHRREWRDDLDAFRPDDGRFDAMLEEMRVEVIYSLKEVMRNGHNQSTTRDKALREEPAQEQPSGGCGRLFD